MAMFPCQVGNHRYKGPQQSIYAAALNGSFAARAKLRLCPEHFPILGKWIEDNLVLVAIDDEMVSPDVMEVSGCYECGSTDTPWQLFSDVYMLKQPPRNYYGKSCTEHLEPFRVEARLEL